MRHLQPQICQHGFVVVFLLFSLPGHGNGQTPGYKLNTQESVSVASGLCVEIPCTFNISASRTLSTSVTGIWSRTDISDIVASTDASKVSERTKGRFTLTGKVHGGDCSFSIINAQPEDQGTYVFRFEDGDIKYSYMWNKLNVTVTRAGNGPTSGYELKAQRSVSVESGLCVEIPCTFSANKTLSPSVTGMWRRTDISDIVASTDASKVIEKTKGRFTLTGKVQGGNCSFSISKAQPEDQGTYVFRFEDGDHKYSYSWNKLNVTVTNLSEPTISPVRKLIAGKQITLTCTSHPAPQGCKGNITWEGGRNIENTNNYERKDEDGKVTSISNITFTPSQGDHKSSLTCTVTYSGVSTNSSITLDVEYPPSMTITVSGYNGTYEKKSLTVIEGDTKHVLCEVNSNPVADISWSKNNSIFVGQNPMLVLEKVSVTDGVTYKCLAQNTHGSITATVTINVEYAPRSPTILNYTSASMNCTSAGCLVKVIEGTSLSLLCSAESNPPANLSWAKQNSTDPLNSSSGRLEVSHVTTDNEGDYICQATNKHGRSTLSNTVVMISPTNDAFHLVGPFCGILVLLLTVIVMTSFMVKKYKQRRRPPKQAEENESSPPNNSEVVYSNIQRRNIEQKPNTRLSSPNECKNPEEDLQYVTLDFSRSKPNTSPEPQETLYSEVKRN